MAAVAGLKLRRKWPHASTWRGLDVRPIILGARPMRWLVDNSPIQYLVILLRQRCPFVSHRGPLRLHGITPFCVAIRCGGTGAKQ